MPNGQDVLLLREAVTLAKAGNKSNARQLLKRASDLNTNNELVWLWRASLSESPTEAAIYLEQVLRINPSNEKAQAWLQKCRPGAKPPGSSPAEEPARDPVPVGVVVSPAETSSPRPGASRPTPEAYSSRLTPPQAQPAIRLPQAETGMRPAPAGLGGHGQAGNGALGPGRPAAPALSTPAVATGPKWRCPFCEHPAEKELQKCPNCKAVTVLRDIREIEANEGVLERSLRNFIGETEKTPPEKRDFDTHLNLALAHLNLRETSNSIPHLKAACALRPNEWTLLGELDQLLRRKLVLVVDDSLTVRKAVSSILERNQLRVVQAEDGMQALARLNEAVPDLVLLDITMPWMDGYQVCKVIKENALTKKVPVVMLSGKDGIFDKVRGRLAGAKDYITKPFEPKNLLKAVRSHLQ